ncbi:mechanosensitive ion channel domain-containing protein [Leptolyngbya sp. CCY15150]|jgi:MscS family membrane protein|uniref:mechanosensitive ion channel family protein n=1 Tax=Leptolyngbya sp. CCY15150 TaxID=2767772 RepID=UPI0019529E25|nr:mechanosensitive ion channel domain-containing protein [Leptolyngbya sp. CCY15150]
MAHPAMEPWTTRLAAFQETLISQWDMVRRIGQGIAVALLFDFVVFLGTRLDALPSDIVLNARLLIGLAGLTATWLLLNLLPVSAWLATWSTRLNPAALATAYRMFLQPHLGWLKVVIILLLADLSLLIAPAAGRLKALEFTVALGLAIAIGFLGTGIFRSYFSNYLLNATVKTGTKTSSELLILIRLLTNIGIIVVTAIIFAQTHDINLFGLVASLGIGGLAVAFAAQKVLEQLLGGVVIYLDRPFVVDDYIGLADGTFGRVESIGIRSTKIRTSGKGTVTVVPNNALTQANIENFTDAKKVISLFNLTFYRTIPSEERALIRQVILDSTQDIFGIDSRSTSVSFRNLTLANQQEVTEAQISFFILGTSAVSLDLRRQLLDIANQKITQQLKQFGIAFHCEAPTIYVDSPMTI